MAWRWSKRAAQEESESRSFNGLANLVRDRFIDQGEFEARYLSVLLFGLTIVGALFHSAVLYRGGAITEGDVIAFLGLISLFQFPGLHIVVYIVSLSLGIRQR